MKMSLSGAISRFVKSFTLAGLALAFGGGLCFADACGHAANGRCAPACCHNPDERCAPSGHIVGDTIARGINFAWNPAYLCLSNATFKVCKPPAPRLITTIKIEEPSAKSDESPGQLQPHPESVQ
jgi:hypothetical protein